MRRPSGRTGKGARRLGRWKVGPLPAGTAFDSVSELPLLTARITVPAGMLGPVIGWPRSLKVKVAVADVNVVLPVLAQSVKSASGITLATGELPISLTRIAGAPVSIFVTSTLRTIASSNIGSPLSTEWLIS